MYNGGPEPCRPVRGTPRRTGWPPPCCNPLPPCYGPFSTCAGPACTSHGLGLLSRPVESRFCRTRKKGGHSIIFSAQLAHARFKRRRSRKVGGSATASVSVIAFCPRSQVSMRCCGQSYCSGRYRALDDVPKTVSTEVSTPRGDARRPWSLCTRSSDLTRTCVMGVPGSTPSFTSGASAAFGS